MLFSILTLQCNHAMPSLILPLQLHESSSGSFDATACKDFCCAAKSAVQQYMQHPAACSTLTKGLHVRRCEVAQADFGHLALPTAGMSMAMAPATSGAGRKLLGSL